MVGKTGNGTRPTARLAVAAAAVALIGSGFIVSSPARADSVEWCWDDPIVTINGVTLQTLIAAQGSPSSVQAAVKSANVTYIVPNGVQTNVVAVSAPFFKEKVDFQTDDHSHWTPGQPVPVTVVTSFKSKQTFPTQMQNIENDVTVTTNGSTDSGLTATFTLLMPTSSGPTRAPQPPVSPSPLTSPATSPAVPAATRPAQPAQSPTPQPTQPPAPQSKPEQNGEDN